MITICSILVLNQFGNSSKEGDDTEAYDRQEHIAGFGRTISPILRCREVVTIHDDRR